MVVTCFCVIRPLVIVVVAVSFTTVPSGWVVVVVFVVEVVALVVTGEGGTTTGGAVLDDEQPATDPQTATEKSANETHFQAARGTPHAYKKTAASPFSSLKSVSRSRAKSRWSPCAAH